MCEENFRQGDGRRGFEFDARANEWGGAGESGNAGAVREPVWEVWFPQRGDAAGVWVGGGFAGCDVSAAESVAAGGAGGAGSVHGARASRGGDRGRRNGDCVCVVGEI